MRDKYTEPDPELDVEGRKASDSVYCLFHVKSF